MHPPGPLHQHPISLCAQGRALLKGTPTSATTTTLQPFLHLPPPVPMPAATTPDFPVVWKPQPPTPISACL
jgi:hypothetical protein